MLGIIITLTIYIILRIWIDNIRSKLKAKKAFEKYNNKKIRFRDIQ